ncbi:hypothetical protein [Cellulomonas wangsupingiae]|uniref:Uncharacterized protein n=1 Tax=Cellulomonas wangsupingiae TaxID=2968085 RepID=A0ABY5KC40_9CELL|nr:hypothetical protein [Cellulomonas wangsupingiae]MCC2334287.1 hypothetical protein [Cellulomonas wangsupingiae]UUI65963.1 hypothetical protein NP075_04300 [Cellulomonas wangsupingiae]
MSTAPRRPRRAVRPSGTVGDDESVLRTAVPAAPHDDAPSAVRGDAGGPAPAPAAPGASQAEAPTATPPTATPPAAGPADPWTALRSADDSDQGWGRDEPSSNDERLRREKPPHW